MIGAVEAQSLEAPTTYAVAPALTHLLRAASQHVVQYPLDLAQVQAVEHLGGWVGRVGGVSANPEPKAPAMHKHTRSLAACQQQEDMRLDTSAGLREHTHAGAFPLLHTSTYPCSHPLCSLTHADTTVHNLHTHTLMNTHTHS